MRTRKYTLPRHTNLAKQGARTGAFFVDLAIALALTLGFFFGVFNLAFRPITVPQKQLIAKEQISSGLYTKNKAGNPERIPSSKNHKAFEDSLKYYYFEYLPKVCKEKKEVSVKWFNVNILEVDPSNKDAIYVIQEGKDIKTDFAVLKKDVVEEEVGKFIQHKYEDAILDDFNEIGYIKAAGRKRMTFDALGYTLATFLGTAITYVVLPLVLKNGQTLGKKLFRLGLANSDGYKMKNTQLLMRYMPLFVCVLSFMLLVSVHLYIVILIYLIILLVSFAVGMASPKKMALHDFTARTMVVDLHTSILFENEVVEEKYLLKEDNILNEIEEEKEYNGEEPELKYEK